MAAGPGLRGSCLQACMLLLISLDVLMRFPNPPSLHARVMSDIRMSGAQVLHILSEITEFCEVLSWSVL